MGADLYSATKQQLRTVRQQNYPRNESPVVVRNDVLVVVEQELPLSKPWGKTGLQSGEGSTESVGCPGNGRETDHDLVREGEIVDSVLVLHDGEWFVHLVVTRQQTVREAYNGLLALDRRTRRIAEFVALSDRKATFYGLCARRIREHYSSSGSV